MSKTPNGSRILIIGANGVGHDIADAVGTIYDLLAGSMDWGSDFITVDDAVGFVRLVDLAGYADPDAKRVEERREWARVTLAKASTPAGVPLREMDRPTWERWATERTLLEQARAQIAAEASS